MKIKVKSNSNNISININDIDYDKLSESDQLIYLEILMRNIVFNLNPGEYKRFLRDFLYSYAPITYEERQISNSLDEDNYTVEEFNLKIWPVKNV